MNLKAVNIFGCSVFSVVILSCALTLTLLMFAIDVVCSCNGQSVRTAGPPACEPER